MQLIHLTYHTSQLSLAYLECAQNTHVSTVGKNHLTQSPFCNEMSNTSCNSLNAILNMKNRMVSMVVHVWVVYLCDRVAD